MVAERSAPAATEVSLDTLTTPARPTFRSLRTQLLVELGLFTSSAVIIVGVTTAVLLGGNLEAAIAPLVVLWGGSTVVFAVFGAHLLKRSVVAPLARLAAEADTLADGAPPPPAPRYGSVELDRLAGRYRAMAAALLDLQTHAVRVEKLAGIGQLAAGVAHEVRNPLGALATYVEVLRRRGAAPDVTAEMQQAIGRIDRTVQSLLDYAKPPTAVGECDSNHAVRIAVDFLTAQGLLREGELLLALAPDLPPVQGSSHALEQVVINLVLNAVQAAPGGRVTVGTAMQVYERRPQAALRAGEDDRPVPARRAPPPRPRRMDLAAGTAGVLLYVADDGPGVPTALRERIFDPFFSTKEPGQGTGLGLAIVARTVHDAGGMVWVDPGREGGAVFKVFLPIAGTTHARADR